MFFFFFYAKEHGEKNTFLPNNKIRKIYAPLAHKKEFCCFWKREGKKKKLGEQVDGLDRSFVYGFFKKNFESRLLILPNMSQVTRFGPRNAGKRLTDFTALLPIIVPL